MENVILEFYKGDTYTRDLTISGFSMPVNKMFFYCKRKNK